VVGDKAQVEVEGVAGVANVADLDWITDDFDAERVTKKGNSYVIRLPPACN
jgi:hypothetical protein